MQNCKYIKQYAKGCIRTRNGAQIGMQGSKNIQNLSLKDANDDVRTQGDM